MDKGKPKTIISLCKKLGEKVEPNWVAFPVTIGVFVISDHCIVKFKKGKKDEVEEVVGELTFLVRVVF